MSDFSAERLIEGHKLEPIDDKYSPSTGHWPAVLIAILAKQKEGSLPLFLECLDRLEYPKDRISIYVRTNNNTDNTLQILEDWIGRSRHFYADVEMDAEDVAVDLERYGVHEWNPTRFKVLAQIRNQSLSKALDRRCAFYFTIDVDNFVRPETLRKLVECNLPIVAPLLRAIVPNAFSSNYFGSVDANGYYVDSDLYIPILYREVVGIFEVPLVHMTYLIRSDVIPQLTYEDGSERYEFVIFSDSARRGGVSQYIDNRHVYGYITCDDDARQSEENFGVVMMQQATAARQLLSAVWIERPNAGDDEGPPSCDVQDAPAAASDLIQQANHGDAEEQLVARFSGIYEKHEWGYGSGHGSISINSVPYVEFLQMFIKHNEVKTVVDFGCGDWQFSRFMDWSQVEYVGIDIVESVISSNRGNFSKPGITFENFTSIEDLPDADLLLCKDVLQHLSNRSILKYVNELAGKFKFLLFANDDLPDEWVNSDILDGNFRPVRLDREPFFIAASVVFTWNLVWTEGGRVAPRKIVQLVMGEQAERQRRLAKRGQSFFPTRTREPLSNASSRSGLGEKDPDPAFVGLGELDTRLPFDEQFQRFFRPRLGRRADGFAAVFEAITSSPQRPLIIETGCLRSPGNWEWDGQSSFMFDALARNRNGRFISIDSTPEHVATARRACSSIAEFICSDSIASLYDLGNVIDEPVSLLYLDSVDLNVADPMPSAIHHLMELAAARPLIGTGTIVCVDDYGVEGTNGGKGLLIDEFFKRTRARVLYAGYQKAWLFT